MLETQEDIDTYLEELGEDLLFQGFILKAIPNVDVSFLTRGEDGIYGTEVQEISFTTSSKICKTKNIVADKQFKLSDGVYLYTFQIRENPIHDLTGWCKLKTNYVSKKAV